MKNSIVVIGAGGHAWSVITLLRRNDFVIRGVYDENYHTGEKIAGFPLLGKLASIGHDDLLVLAVGDNSLRESKFKEYREQVLSRNILHPSSLVEDEVSMGEANLVFARVYINSNVSLGDNNIINSAAVLEHEVKIGSHNHVSVNAVICGRTVIGSRCFIGAGAVLKDKLRITDDVVVGANATVLHDIETPGTYAGNPARKIE